MLGSWYSTGAAFYALAAQIHFQQTASRGPGEIFPVWECTDEDDADIRWWYGRNMLYFHLSPFTIDLESPPHAGDPLTKGMDPCSTFCIDNIDPSVSTRDIVRCLSHLTDGSGHRVNYEIIWIHDVCFLVGAMVASREPAKFREHGGILLKALKGRFGKATITRLVENDSAASSPASSIWNLWGLLGGGAGHKRAQPDDTCSGPSKRRRLG